MKSTLLFALSLMSVLSWSKEISINPYKVIPEPQEITYERGIFEIKNQISVAYPQELSNEVFLMKEWFVDDFDTRLELLKDKKKGTIILSLDPDTLKGLKEGYIINIQRKNIKIIANSSAGILYGIQTLRQILHKNNGSWIAQMGTIKDYPTLEWRSLMLDEARYFKGKDVVLRLLDNMAQLKFNVFHWHLTDDTGWRIEIKKYPKLTEIGAYRDSSEINGWYSNVYDGKPHGGFYTQNEIKEIIEYAKVRHIMIIPEIEMPGHASAATSSYPWLGTTKGPSKEVHPDAYVYKQWGKVLCSFGIDLDVFNIADPRVIDFLKDVLEEVITLFPSPVVHIGGDEVPYRYWKASKEMQQYMKVHGFKTCSEFQIYFTNQMSEWLASKNHRMMGWNEIMGMKVHDNQSQDDFNNISQSLASGTIVQFWQGNPDMIKQTIEKGYDIVNSYSDYTYLDFDYQRIPLSKAYSFQPVPDGLTTEQQKKVLGFGCQMWCEWIPTETIMNRQVYPRIAAYAECGWTNPPKKDYNRFIYSLEYFLKKWEKQGIACGPLK